MEPRRRKILSGHTGVLPWCRGACSTAVALMLGTRTHEASAVLSVCDGWRYRALQVGRHARAAVCLPNNPVPTVT